VSKFEVLGNHSANCPDTFSKRFELLDLSKSDLAGNLAVIYRRVLRVAGQLLDWSQTVF
jgi:hypothetical protein